MSSRVTLSVLAFVSGAAFMNALLFYGLVPMPKFNTDMWSHIFILFGLGLCALAWWRVFSRRPK
ncbi:MAG: hypothetical protein OEY85_01860 [Rhodospirillales bacterium]|nr:hypothetical protein [Rhodospirillales bacterium]